LARWIVERNAWPQKQITIHSWNPEGTKRMAEILSAGPVPIVIKAFEA
jgi:hypothetical protein